MSFRSLHVHTQKVRRFAFPGRRGLGCRGSGTDRFRFILLKITVADFAVDRDGIPLTHNNTLVKWDNDQRQIFEVTRTQGVGTRTVASCEQAKLEPSFAKYSYLTSQHAYSSPLILDRSQIRAI